MQTLALIPARKGSKRIPDKNIKDFCGVPIISYSIKAAVDWRFTEVMVYTDSPKYTKIAKEFGAKVPFRREKADDKQKLFDVVKEVLLHYKLHKQMSFEYVCLIYPCAPFINPELIETGYNLMLWGNHDAVFPVVPNSFHYQQLLYFRGDRIKHVFPAFRDTPSNDWEQTYRHAGQYFWVKTASLKYNKTLISDNSGAIIIHPWEAIDIDTTEDWEYAEIKYKMLQEMEYR
jgi:pseudaminic acid cytidylyltransferase